MYQTTKVDDLSHPLLIPYLISSGAAQCLPSAAELSRKSSADLCSAREGVSLGEGWQKHISLCLNKCNSVQTTTFSTIGFLSSPYAHSEKIWSLEIEQLFAPDMAASMEVQKV